ncbi:Mismatch repair endonuclease PMS2 [Caenorhabditis elegans]|uniref:Mismatch repair endonuclease PMS2 n=1 Tax=Caenorhabditis elegans TaxID=6239 RepID=G5EFG5_CAEEL|nr:Mismatch repair endonuclease PMS2 [Caenorhabditis elegans]CAA18355.1 Mismatch repair endonuclease PMS2 [Caenorhabditis elegans]|eukprot:NP_505933.1 PMS (Post Meiotic Segregation) family [Caenorhabditis elegans]
MSQNKIERISKEVAERLTTAQVVVSLSSAIRQLIDNSIDAGSTIIDIRVKNNGFESIEVQDNGSGIEARNFDALCKPHSTSKLTQFSDFDKLATLGFRGEALNALCTVSSVSIFTRASDTEIGTRLTYDHSGNIICRQSAARELGTTIIVNKLFETLPVRRKELERSQKREFVKLLSTVQSFALLCPHIKILCTNNINGKKTNLICTPGGTTSIQDVVANLFGIARKIENSKIGSGLIPIQQNQPDVEIMTIHSVPMEEMHFFDLFKIRGFVSSCEHGCGRGTSDRQFVYINNRPVEYSRVCSVINDVYKQFNKKQYPIIVLFIDVPPEKIDVNVTPDKKTVMLEKERHLLAVVRASMMKTYLKIVGSHSTVRSSVEDRRIMNLSQQSFSNASFMSSKSSTPDDFNNTTLNSTYPEDSLLNTSDLLKQRKENRSPPAKKSCPMIRRTEPFHSVPSTSNSRTQRLENFSFTMEPKRVEVSKKIPSKSDKKLTDEELRSAVIEENPLKKAGEIDDIEILEQSQESQDVNESQCSQDSQTSQNSRVSYFTLRPQQKIKFSMKLLREAYSPKTDETDDNTEEAEVSAEKDVLNEITTKINKEENDDAERQLSRSLTKDDFSKMKIIGQFNHGFIICRLRGHLFIVDQHASDEKYNFERLQSSAKLTKQPLFMPTALGFGAVQELIIRENLPIFHANGFDFEFSENDGCIKTFLTARPELLNQQLTNSDLEEILAVVSQYPNQMYRPVRIRKIFASKACRKSVMIGKPLNQREMTQIIRHLAKLDQPWNCPHGRPTIRHLASLPDRAEFE